jgi:LacI family transcriptional regulator
MPESPFSFGTLPTIKDVARAAGVHYSTVSLALRDDPRIPLETRKRVRACAEKLGYKREAVQFALTARQRSVTATELRPRLTFLTNRASPETFFDTAHMRDFLAGAREQADLMGYACELLLVGDETVSDGEIEDKLAADGTVGVILAAFQPQLRRIRLDWTRYAVVKIDSAFMPPAATLISNDQMQITRLAFQKLHALGYRRIGMAVGRNDEENTRDLFAAGCLLEQERLQLSSIPPLHFGGGDDHDSAAPRIAAWLKHHRVEVVVSNWRSVNELLARALSSKSPRVACACLCLNGPDPQVAGVVQDHHLVGRRAAETLALLVQNGVRGVPAHPSATYVEGRWHDGPSAPPCRP